MQQEELDRLADLMGVPHKNVTEFGYINDFPLLADNEPARHKLLDVLGDIALIGRPMRGKVIATRPDIQSTLHLPRRYARRSSIRNCRPRYTIRR